MTPVHILVVDDNPADAELIRDGLSTTNHPVEVTVVHDGASALSFLNEEAKAPKRQADLVVLDLNLPGKHGREVLREIRASADLCKIPVVILSSSSADKDIEGTYALGANCYVTKPVGFREFMDVIHRIEDFWLEVARLP